MTHDYAAEIAQSVLTLADAVNVMEESERRACRKLFVDVRDSAVDANRPLAAEVWSEMFCLLSLIEDARKADWRAAADEFYRIRPPEAG